MNDMSKAFRLIVVKYKRQVELFDDKPKYHIVASNRIESAETALVWYRQRGEVSENGIKELKIGFGMNACLAGSSRQMPPFFRIGVIAHNLFALFKRSALGGNWQRHRLAAVCAGGCFICQEKWCVTPVRWCSRSPPSSSSYSETAVLKATNSHDLSLPG
ncbi:hypothetical protein SAMN05421754_10045 [Nitrosomonas sp. Nm58]|nr:hypothetical protein SAMN05421754_10045 [Nitrosomonas sp. Nm58]